jgi:hypothetical protein
MSAAALYGVHNLILYLCLLCAHIMRALSQLRCGYMMVALVSQLESCLLSIQVCSCACSTLVQYSTLIENKLYSVKMHTCVLATER